MLFPSFKSTTCVNACRIAKSALKFQKQALDLLGEAGFDPVYGARPMKRAIQQQLENPLAQQILAGNFVAGDTIKVDVEHETLRFLKG